MSYLDPELVIDRLDKIIDLLTTIASPEQPPIACPKCGNAETLVEYQNEKRENRILCTACSHRFSHLIECPQKSSA